MRLIQRGARLRRSPFFEATLRYGCRAYTVYNHMFLPSYYDDPVNEYWHLLNEVTLWDVSVERNTEITGPDAFRFTSLLTPRDLSKCSVGQGKYVLITSEDGGIVNDPVLLRLGERHFWLAGADSDLLLYAKGLAAHSGMNVTIREPDVSPLQVVAEFLQLQPPQINALGQLLEARQTALVPLFETAQQLTQQLGVALNNGANPAQVGALLIQIHALQQQMAQAQQAFVAQFLALLVPDQLQQLQAVQIAVQVQPVLPAFKLIFLF